MREFIKKCLKKCPTHNDGEKQEPTLKLCDFTIKIPQSEKCRKLDFTGHGDIFSGLQFMFYEF